MTTATLRTLLVAVLALVASTASAQTIGATLQNALAGAAPADRIEVIVTFHGDGPITVQQQSALAAVGVPGVMMQSLPMAGVLATPAQIDQIAGLQGVRSVWLNEELEYDNDEATALTGVDRLRNDPSLRTALDLPFTGEGIGVLVNDSGVDGTHPDLADNVVQNVSAQTNLNSLSTLLPVSYVEGNPNTDIGGGHGTHVAGIVAGTGAASNGRYEGVAPGADIIGYGSGAGLFILDTAGGFDYALTNQFAYNIRVVSNSFGSTGDIGTDFDPDHPTNVATKILADRGIIVVFSAGNSGPGEDTVTGNFKKAPWVIMVGNGDTLGGLANSSSRGIEGRGGDVTVGNRTFTWDDRPTVVAPGTRIVSVRATLGDGAPEPELGADAAFYSTLSGTSMACPHVSGIVALMLEADPTLDVYDVKRILQTTATNMPGRAIWEVGAGYVNAHAAVANVRGQDVGALSTVANLNDFKAEPILFPGESFPVSVFFTPVGERETETFEVGEDIAIVKARARVSANTVSIRLTSPSGKRYSSGITLPILGEIAAVQAPGEPGTWTYSVGAIGGLTTGGGIDLDPLGVTNGYAVPGEVAAEITLIRSGGFTALGDIDGHPAQAFIELAVQERLVDSRNLSLFRPDVPLMRLELAQYLMLSGGVRQATPGARVRINDARNADLRPFVEAVTARGGAMKDRDGVAPGLMRTENNRFYSTRAVTRAELAYSLVAALGLHDVASGYDGTVVATYGEERVALADSDAIPADLRGYVQFALDAGLIDARFGVEQGPFDLEPTITATFNPDEKVTRAAYTVAAVRLLEIYEAADPSVQAPGAGDAEAASALPALASADDASGLTLEGAAPNPTTSTARIAFTLAEAGPARLAVYDMLGREVAVLTDGSMNEGRHEVRLDATALSAGTYVYRLTAGAEARTGRLTVAR